MKTFFKQKPIRLKGKAKTEFRKKVFEHFNGRCQGVLPDGSQCEERPPLMDSDGVFDVFTCGHVSHIKSVGSGGEDILENVLYKCYNCHINKEHGLKWSK